MTDTEEIIEIMPVDGCENYVIFKGIIAITTEDTIKFKKKFNKLINKYRI